jgi:hypothetical protein
MATLELKTVLAALLVGRLGKSVSCRVSLETAFHQVISRVGHDNGALEQSDGRRASEESSYGASTGFDPMSAPADTPRRHGYRRRTSSGSRCWLSTSPVSATRQDIPPSSGDSKGCQIRAFCPQSIRPYMYVSPELPPTPLRLGLPRSAVPGAIGQGFPKDPSNLSVQHQALAVRLIPVSLPVSLPLPYPSAVAFFVCLVLHARIPVHMDVVLEEVDVVGHEGASRWPAGTGRGR